MKGRLSYRFLLVFGGIVLGLLVTELYFRRFNPQATISNSQPAGYFPCYRQGTYYWAKLKPSSVCTLHSNYGEFPDILIRTNGLGLRNREISVSKPKGRTRLLFIGDSFTFGWGVEEDQSYPRLVEKALREYMPDIEIINAGKPDSDPGYYYLYLKNEGLELNPDIVVVGFDVMMDVANVANNMIWEEMDDQGLPVKVTNKIAYIDSDGRQKYKKIPLKFRVPILNRSYLFAFLADNVFSNKQSGGETDTSVAIEKIELLFRAMKSQLQEKGEHLIIAIIPPIEWIDEDYRLAIGLPKLGLPIDPLNSTFTRFFQENGIDFIDLLPKFVLNIDKNSFYYKRDGHWNAVGQREAAKILSEKIDKFIAARDLQGNGGGD